MTTIKSEIVGRDKGLRSQHRLQRFHQASVMREWVHSSVGRSGNGPFKTRKRTCSPFFLSENGVFAKTVPKNWSDAPVNYARINTWKPTRAVIPNAQISLGRVTGYSSEITISGANQFHVPPRGVSTVMLNEEEVRCEWPKSVRSARPSGEISIFICQACMIPSNRLLEDK